MRPRIDGAWVEVPFEVQAKHGGLRVDAFLTQRLHRYSRSEVQRLIAAGRILRRGRPSKTSAHAVKPSARVATGETVLVRYPRREEPPPRHDSLPVLFEDEQLLIVNKPGDVLSHPTDKVIRNSVTSILRGQFPRERLHLVHRLDRETSGVLVLAKNPAAARSLTEQFTRRQVQKEYLTLAVGRVAFDRLTVDSPLVREGAEIKVRQAVKGAARTSDSSAGGASTAAGERGSDEIGARGVSAVTEFERLDAGVLASLVRASPKTGRLHQIRVHLASIGHPVIGDKLYTGSGEMYMKAVRRELDPEDLEALGAPRQMLHAWRLRLTHPASRAPLEIAALPPTDFQECLARNGLAHRC